MWFATERMEERDMLFANERIKEQGYVVCN
jgi:hypothetical protein